MSTITLPERFDVHEVPDFEAQVLGVDGDLTIDLGDVRFLDGEALRALVKSRADAIVAGNDLAVVRMSTTARVTLELTGLAEALPVRTELAEVA